MFCICAYVVSLIVLESFGLLFLPIDGCVESCVFFALVLYFACVYAVNMFRSPEDNEVISFAVYINVVVCFVVFSTMCGVVEAYWAQKARKSGSL